MRSSTKLPKTAKGFRRLAIQCLEDAAIFALEAEDTELHKAISRILRKLEKQARKNKC